MWHSAAGPASLRDRVVVALGTVAALALGGCKSSTAPAPPTGPVALWVVTFGGTILGYTATQLASSTSAAPKVVVSTAGTGEVAFDASGNLWTTDEGANAVVEYTASQLVASGSPTPNVTLTANAAGSLNFPVALAFDAGGNLWVGNYGPLPRDSGTLVKFTPRQLAASGSPTPAVTLSDNAGSISLPRGLAFDHSGNLWMCNTLVVVAFSASQLASSGSPVPAVTLSADANISLDGPVALAFDGGGNLWVANINANVVEFASSQLGSTGSPTPAVTLTSAPAAEPTGLAFDGHGNLRVTSSFFSTVVEFAASQLRASGAPAPNVTLSGASISPLSGLAFTP
jgi:sugar lactone lactonase YvrE